MLLIKLGGSVITNKEKALSPRKAAVVNIARVLKKTKEPVIIVHGGGSFGHYWSVKYDMHTKPDRYSTKGVAVVKDSMMKLNNIISTSLLKGGLLPYVVQPDAYVTNGKPVQSRIKEMFKMANFGMVPTTYGDALWYGNNKSFILSGDRIMYMLASTLRPRLCMFLTNVDGLYDKLSGGNLIYDATKKTAMMSKVGKDVTGGMIRKVQEAKRISSAGIDVVFINGNKPERILDATKGKQFKGTVFYGA